MWLPGYVVIIKDRGPEVGAAEGRVRYFAPLGLPQNQGI